jgi:hypothetical protein
LIGLSDLPVEGGLADGPERFGQLVTAFLREAEQQPA